jgi:hypothetical protein
MFYLVEVLDRAGGEITEKIAGTQAAGKAAFNAVQAGNAHILSRSPRRNTPAAGLASTI